MKNLVWFVVMFVSIMIVGYALPIGFGITIEDKDIRGLYLMILGIVGLFVVWIILLKMKSNGQ